MYETGASLNDLLSLLPVEQFEMPQKSYIVNFDHVTSITNTKVINGNPSDKIFYVKGGEMTISGDVDCDYNTIAADNGGVIITRPGINNICCDVSLLNAKESSVVINTNKSLPCGVGLVVLSGSTWKNLATGSVYETNK